MRTSEFSYLPKNFSLKIPAPFTEKHNREGLVVGNNGFVNRSEILARLQLHRHHGPCPPRSVCVCV